VSNTRAYGTPAAFRRALTDRLRTEARNSEWTLNELQRQFAYDRLLARLYTIDDGWIVKGAAALLARRLSLRATRDIDVYRQQVTEVAEAAFRAAVAVDLGDWFRFEVLAVEAPASGVGLALPVKAYIGETEWASFRVDLVGADFRMTGKPEPAPPLAQIDIPDVEQREYRVYPLVDHVADKIAATFERYTTAQSPSTRYRDLIDLVAIVKGASVPAEEQKAALASEARRRKIQLPNHFEVPDRELWEKGYAAAAKKWKLKEERTLDEALAVVSPFADPLLDGTASGRWKPSDRRWK
jgi:Nucleotidyl transferase AbiEii toxin, Type IV TA system